MTDKHPTTKKTTDVGASLVVTSKEGEAMSVPGSVVAANAAMVAANARIARFRGRPMVMVEDPYPHFVPLHREMFDRIAYPILGGVSRSRMSDVFAFLGNTAIDLTANDRYVLFGLPHEPTSRVWDMRGLDWADDVDHDMAIWRSPFAPLETDTPEGFVLSLAGGDRALYEDIMQSLAPMIMGKKPDGVIWWVGDGANGKSTLMDAIYRVFPGQLSSLNVKRLTDGRDTPSLNGTLANIVKESSEGRIDDTEIYKSIGTHENFRVHKFHSQDDIEIRGNIHHIFSANSVPGFNDKGYSARRRTFIVPFGQRFESDPEFESRTFTPEMFGQLISQMCAYASRLAKQGYRYKWSAATLAAKGNYDTDANNAEVYAKHLIDQGVVGFDGFSSVKMDYENWCADEGYVPLGITNLRRAMGALGFERTSAGLSDTGKLYKLDDFNSTDLQPFGMGRPGMYTVSGFQPTESTTETTQVPDFEPVEEPEPAEPSILKGKW